jgi:hypothetical protein
MELYGLYSDKQKCLMSFSTSANCDGEFCNDVEVSLSKWFSGCDLWTSPNRKEAERICEIGPTEWYNASLDTPNWNSEYYGGLRVEALSSH